MRVAKILWYDILLVWTFFTRIPAPHFMTDRTLSQSLWAMPLIALLMVVVQVSALFMLSLVGSKSLMASIGPLILTVIPIVFTGALHWDGLADLADGLGVSKTRRAQVMRDPTVGAFAILAVIILFATQILLFGELLNLNQQAFPISALAMIALLSRQFMVVLWTALPPADKTSQANRLGRPNPWIHGGLFITLCLVFWALGTLDIWGLGAFFIFALAWGAALRRWLGGINGDGLGATQIVTETFLLFGYVLSCV